MAIPDMTRKITFCFESDPNSLNSPLAKTIAQMRISITIVRMAVARLELMFCTPNLEKMAVRAANNAASKA